MKYKLYPNSLNDLNDIKNTVLKNRGYEYPVGSFDDIVSDFTDLEFIKQAVQRFDRFIYEKTYVDIIVDCDFDGYASASIMYRYIKEMFPMKQIRYHLHVEKKHGLSDDILWDQIEDSLIIIPDAGSNDVEECRALFEQGSNEILILDHHNIEVENHYATVINCHRGNYKNKYLCGTGVTWQFIRALDDFYWTDCAAQYLDMVAVATVADIMNVTEPENRMLIDEGLVNISHPLLVALANKANTSLVDVTGQDIQFGIIPLVNAMVRVGSYDEKELMFKAFCKLDAYFDYKKRGSDEVEEESIYDRVARLCYNAKNRQKNTRDATLDKLIQQIEIKNLDSHKILVVNGTLLNPTLTGVVAAQLSDKYSKPCLVLRKELDDNKEPTGFYTGSGRNSMRSSVTNFNKVLQDTGRFVMVGGHKESFGVKIHKLNIPLLIKQLDEELPDIEPCIFADFICSSDNIGFEMAAKFSKQVRRYCGEGFPEPIIVVENLVVREDQFSTMGKNKNSWKIITDNDVEIVKFNVGDDDPLLRWFDSGEFTDRTITFAATVGMNQWLGKMSAQMIVKDYEMLPW